MYLNRVYPFYSNVVLDFKSVTLFIDTCKSELVRVSVIL